MTDRISPAFLMLLLLTGCADIPANNAEPATLTQLADCPSSPNCVSSTETGRSHYIDPLDVGDRSHEAWQALLDILDADDSISIVSSDDHYIRAEAKTRILRFTDDVEFLLRRESGLIDMRSASRLGFSDLGKNRSRLEGVRTAIQDTLR